jgi:hypothetical protein
MSTQKNTSIKWIFSVLLLAIATLSFAWVYNQSESVTELPGKKEIKSGDQVKIDEKSKKIMMDMDKYLTGLNEFSFQSNGYFEVVDSASGKKEQINNSGELFVKRPNKIKVQRKGEKADLVFYCDGMQVTMYGKKLNYYSSAPVTGNLDDILDKIGEKFNISLPASDLLYTDVYEGLMQDVVSGKYMGKEKMANVTCDHLSFIGKEVDWQIWVEEGEKKLPRKYLIISKQIEGKPEASIEIAEWKTDLKLDDKMFTFTPPKGAQKVDFLQLKTKILAKNK